MCLLNVNLSFVIIIIISEELNYFSSRCPVNYLLYYLNVYVNLIIYSEYQTNQKIEFYNFFLVSKNTYFHIKGAKQTTVCNYPISMNFPHVL